MTTSTTVTLSHGSGGRMTHTLIKELFVTRFANDTLGALGDAALLDVPGGRLAFTTDGFVVSPLFFPGGDIGKLAVCGTVNDLAVAGARPVALSSAMIVQDGFPMADLERIVDSMARTAAEAGVTIVTGDTKVVERASMEGIFVTTSGVGVVDEARTLSQSPVQVGDKVIVNGTLGDHGMSIMAVREGLDFQTDIESDCAPLGGLTDAILGASRGVRFMRDATRGGLAAVVNELVEGAPFAIRLVEDRVPVDPRVAGLCEILGLDPLHVANEGKVVVVVDGADADAVLDAMVAHPLGRSSAIIGEVVEGPGGKVLMETLTGASRIVEFPTGELLPRIC